MLKTGYPVQSLYVWNLGSKVAGLLKSYEKAKPCVFIHCPQPYGIDWFSLWIHEFVYQKLEVIIPILCNFFHISLYKIFLDWEILALV